MDLMHGKACKVIGKVTTEESDEIQNYFQLKNYLMELVLALVDNGAELGYPVDSMREDVKKDLDIVEKQIKTWWDNVIEKYNWDATPNKFWRINFKTGQVMSEI